MPDQQDLMRLADDGGPHADLRVDDATRRLIDAAVAAERERLAAITDGIVKRWRSVMEEADRQGSRITYSRCAGRVEMAEWIASMIRGV